MGTEEGTNRMWTCRLTRPGGPKALIIWNDPRESGYFPTVPYCQYWDIAGNEVRYNGALVVIGFKPLLFERTCAQAKKGPN
jgi:hypothetical protein